MNNLVSTRKIQKNTVFPNQEFPFLNTSNPQDEQGAARGDPDAITRKINKIFFFQPDRCHHCSVCNDCVLKMDHHCPWVNNCVGYYNQKFFFLFLGYAFLYCMYVMLSTLKYFIAYWSHDNAINLNNGKFHVIFLFFVSGMFAISLCSLFSYHIYLISQNRTTLEAFR